MGKDKIHKNRFERRKEIKKYNKRLKKNTTFLKTLPVEIQKDISLLKYWHKRFRLFKKFDQGIKLDKGKIHFTVHKINISLKIYNDKHVIYKLYEKKEKQICI